MKKVKIPIGGLNANKMMAANQRFVNGYWFPARPEPYYSLFSRLKLAWHVLTYKADAFYWPEDLEQL